MNDCSGKFNDWGFGIYIDDDELMKELFMRGRTKGQSPGSYQASSWPSTA